MAPHPQSAGAKYPLDFPFEKEQRQLTARINRKFQQNEDSYGNVLPFYSCVRPTGKTVVVGMLDGEPYKAATFHVAKSLFKLSKQERATLDARPLTFVNVPVETPLAYVSAEVADAFGMHGLPNTIVVKDPDTVEQVAAFRAETVALKFPTASGKPVKGTPIAGVEAKPRATRSRSKRRETTGLPKQDVPRSTRDALRRAFVAELRGRVQLASDDTYVVTDARTKTTRPAPWSAIVEKEFPTYERFQAAAAKWQSPRNARTIETH